MTAPQTVFVIDDDSRIRESLTALLASVGLQVEAFESAMAFLEVYDPSRSGCLVLDIRMPEMSGIELQERLVSKKATIPIIIVSAHADVPTVVRTMKLGSFDFLEKPFSPQQLLETIYKALEQDRRQRMEHAIRFSVQQSLALLTSREREILALVVSGNPSKKIATQLNLTVSTVDNHRANIMRKLRAETPADLTRIALLADPSLGLPT